MADWTQVAAIGTAVGSGATAVSAAIIAWQAYETRRSVRASRDGLALSRSMSVEATKTRLDARAPRLRVLFRSSYDDPVRAWGGSGEPEPWPTSEILRQPKHDRQRFVLAAEFVVMNEGDRSVEISLTGPINWSFRDGRDPSNDAIVLPPGKSNAFWLRDVRPLSDWVQNWQAYERGVAPSQVVVGEVICSDPYDEGVVDRWRLNLICYPFEPVPDETGAWRARTEVGEPRVVTAHVPPQRRQYYVSKRDGQVLNPEAPVKRPVRRPSRLRRVTDWLGLTEEFEWDVDGPDRTARDVTRAAVPSQSLRAGRKPPSSRSGVY